MNNKDLVLSQNSISISFYDVFKRAFDIVVSGVSLVVLSPLFLIISILIRKEDKGNAIYTQERIGENGLLFKLYKFRTMVSNADEVLNELIKNNEDIRMEYQINKKLKNDPRITKIGAFLRKTSIDELPQLINVFKGEMSLIGNRPYLPKEINDMGNFYEEIISTKPGITGYWQVGGRNNNTFKTRCKMEAYYSNNRNLKMDIKIFFKTFKSLFKGL